MESKYLLSLIYNVGCKHVKIAIWDSESESTINFVQTAEVFADVLLYDTVEDLLDAPAEDVDLIVFDYDSDKKSIDKFIKKLRKEDDEVKILILSNVLTPKQLVKHQNSKSGGDIYLRTPVTLDLLKSIFEPFFDIEIDGDSSGIIPPAPTLSREDKTIQTQIIKDHKMDSEMSDEARTVSEEIQNKFNVVFPPEEDKAAAALEEIARQEEQEALEAQNDFEIEDISLEEDTAETEDALELGDDTDALELGDDSKGLSLLDDEGEDEVKVPDEDDLTYPDLSTDMLKEENDTEENIESKKEPDMSGHDETDLEMDNLETLELGGDEEGLTATVDDGAMELAVDDTDGLDLSDGDDEETTATVDDGAMDLNIADDAGLDLSSGDDEETTAAVDDGAIDLDIDDTDALDVSAAGDASVSVDIVTDELDLDAAPVEVEAVVEDSEDSLELGADEDEFLDLGADEESLDLGGDDEFLDLGGDDESLDLGGDDESLDLGADDESLDLGSDDGDSIDLGEDEIEFGVNGDNIDEVVEEANLSATDLPAAPDGLEDLAFGSGEEIVDQDLSFDSEEPGAPSGDFTAKMAEIDAMMDDSPGPVVQEEATGEHEIPAELHAQAQMDEIDNMTEIMPFQTLAEDDGLDGAVEDSLAVEEGLEDLAFGSGEEAIVEEIEEDDLDFTTQEEVVEAPPAEPEPVTPAIPVSSVATPAASISDHNAYMQHHGEELTRYGETIKNLREEREDLLSQITKVEDKNEVLRRDQLDMKSELDEKKIELSIVKKRHEKQVEELKYHLDVSNDRREVLEEKNKQFEKEYEHLNRKIKVDLNKVRSRERDLENKLEMLRADAELQIRNRDQKILELKRKIDTLQFDVESIQVQERKVASNSHQLEDKMQKVIRTLRRAIGDLEEDGSSIRSIEEIKKNLDV